MQLTKALCPLVRYWVGHSRKICFFHLHARVYYSLYIESFPNLSSHDIKLRLQCLSLIKTKLLSWKEIQPATDNQPLVNKSKAIRLKHKYLFNVQSINNHHDCFFNRRVRRLCKGRIVCNWWVRRLWSDVYCQLTGCGGRGCGWSGSTSVDRRACISGGIHGVRDGIWCYWFQRNRNHYYHKYKL